jgi:hypothetical protein
MLTALHRVMSQRKYSKTNINYRKRPAPCRIVPFESLIKTNVTNSFSNDDTLNGLLVNHNGVPSSGNTWSPLRTKILPIAVSTTSWEGLRKRLNASQESSVEVF